MVGFVRTIVQLSSHSCPKDKSDEDLRAGIIWPCLPAGLKSGKGSSHTCVDCMCAPLGWRIVIGFVATTLLVALVVTLR